MKKFLLAFLFAVAVFGFFGFQKYKTYLLPNVPNKLDSFYVEIPTGSSFEEVTELLYNQGFIKEKSSFIEVSERLKYKREIMRAGRFKIDPNWNNLSLVRHLRGGKQEPVKLVLSHARLLEDIAGKAARSIGGCETRIIH